MPMRRISIALLIITLFVARSAWAFCESFPNPTQEYGSSTFVFVGTVLSKEDIPETDDFIAGTRYLVKVKEVLKGKPDQSVSLYSENTTSRFPMEIGQVYLVFTLLGVFEELQEKQLFINSCGNSGLLKESATAITIVRKLAAKKSKR